MAPQILIKPKRLKAGVPLKQPLRLSRAAVAVNDAATVRDALQTAIDLVCAHTGRSIGHADLRTDSAGGTPVPSKIWQQTGPSVP